MTADYLHQIAFTCTKFKLSKHFQQIVKINNSVTMNLNNTNMNFPMNASNKLQPLKLINIPHYLVGCIVTNCRPASKQSDLKNPASDLTTKVHCKICHKLFTHSQIDKLKECKHTFCHQCLHNYLTYKTQICQELKCPGCNANINPISDVCFDRLPLRVKERYLFKRKLMQDMRIKQTERLCITDDCKGIVDFSKPKPQCTVCQKQYCKQCLLSNHGDEPCRYHYYKNFIEWKRCPNCRVFLQETTSCNHFLCELPQSICLVCIMGWSDKFHHFCKRQQQDPLLRDVFWRDSIMQTSWFINIFRGILLLILFPVIFLFLITLFLILFVLIVVVSFITTPFVVVYNGITDQQYSQIIVLFLCFPCEQTYWAIQNVDLGLISKSTSYIDFIVTYLLTTKAMFYYNDSYKQNLSNYTKMESGGCFRRGFYIILMLAYLPFLLVLPLLFFLIASLFLIVFVLITMPIMAYIEKKIPIWVSILFFPIVFFHIITIDFGVFLRDQGKQLWNFYPQYFKTFAGYFCPTEEEDTSLIQWEKNKDLHP